MKCCNRPNNFQCGKSRLSYNSVLLPSGESCATTPFFPVAYLVLKQVVSSNKSGRVIPCEAFHYKLPLFFVELHLVRRRFNFQEAKILGIHLKSALIMSKIPYQVYQISHSYRNNSQFKFDILKETPCI